MVQANLDQAHPLTGSMFKLTHPNQRFKQETPVRVQDQIADAGTWFTEHIVAIGNRIVVTVNDRIVADHVNQAEPLISGHLALKQWPPGTTVVYRNVMVKPLPADKALAWAEARKDLPDLPQ